MRKLFLVLIFIFALFFVAVTTNRNIALAAASCTVQGSLNCSDQAATKGLEGKCGNYGGCYPGDMCIGTDNPLLGKQYACYPNQACTPCDNCAVNGPSICASNDVCLTDGRCIKETADPPVNCSNTNPAPSGVSCNSSTVNSCGHNGGCYPGWKCTEYNIWPSAKGYGCYPSSYPSTSCEPCDDCRINGATICSATDTCDPVTGQCTASTVAPPFKKLGEACVPTDICCKDYIGNACIEPTGSCYNNRCVACLSNGAPTTDASKCCSGIVRTDATLGIPYVCSVPTTGCGTAGDMCGASASGTQCCKQYDPTAPETCQHGADGSWECTPSTTPPATCVRSGQCTLGVSNFCCESEGYSCNLVVGQTYGMCAKAAALPPTANTYKGPTVTIKELIALIYKIMVPVSIGFGLFFIIWGGYTIKMSEGDPIKKKAGMEQLTAAIIGTIFVVLSLTILQIIITSVLGGTP